MSSREERQAYEKRWKRVKREFAQLEQAEQQQQQAHLHQEQIQQEHEGEEVPAGSVCSSEEDDGSVYSATDLDICDVPMDGHADKTLRDGMNCSANEMDMKAMRTHIDRVAQRVDQVQDGVRELLMRIRPQSPHVTAEEDVLLSPCRSVVELEELDQSLNKQERRNKMQHYLSSLGGQSGGIAVRRMLRQVATNEVLSQYSLRGRKSKRAFQDLSIYRIITEACQKSFPSLTAAEIEDLTGQALKFAPHRQRPAVKD